MVSMSATPLVGLGLRLKLLWSGRLWPWHRFEYWQAAGVRVPLRQVGADRRCSGLRLVAQLDVEADWFGLLEE
jgi:hypothetical protein